MHGRRAGAPRARIVIVVAVLVASSTGAREARAEPPTPATTPQGQPSAPPEQPATTAPAPTAKQDQEQDALTGTFELKPRILLVMNMLYSQRHMIPGSYATFAVPPAAKDDQFVISPDDTAIGFSISGVSIGHVAFRGGVDVNLKSMTPLSSPNVLGPQFYDASIGAYADRFVIRMGQLTDVIVPFAVPSTNGFPSTYLPGQIGYFRPQLRADLRIVSTDELQLRANGSLGRPIQTLQVANEVVGIQAGVPDLQGRVELGFGEQQDSDDEQVFWTRPYALGVSGHYGRRHIFDLSGQEIAGLLVNTWSVGVDLHVELPSETKIFFRLWRGSVLGDYAGGIFQTVSTKLLIPVHATGFQVAGVQRLHEGWRLAGGFGSDDPDDSDVGVGERIRNQAAYGTLFWDWSKKLGFAAEVSRWRTSYNGQGSTRAWRGELMVMIHI